MTEHIPESSGNTNCVTEVKVELDDTYINVISFGRGARPLVLIAGASLCDIENGEAVANACSVFLDDFRVHLLFRRKVMRRGFTTGQMGDDIIKALRHIGVARADFYGVSQGGMIAQTIAINYPDAVRSLVLCSTLSRSGEMMKNTANEWLRLAGARDVVGLNRYFAERVYSEAFRAANADAFKALENTGTDEDCARFEVQAEACRDFDVYDDVGRIKCPSLVIGAGRDMILGCEGSRETAALLGCRLVVYEDAAHAVYDECADLKELVKGFLLSAESAGA